MELGNASFFEDMSPFRSTHESNSREEAQKTIFEDSQDQWGNKQEVERLSHSKRGRTEKSFGLDFITFLLENESQSFREAMNSTEGPLWKEAINSDAKSILQNHTWKLVDLPPCSKPSGYKWMFNESIQINR